MRFQIREIRVEHQICPLGIDEKSPQISWSLKADEADVLQESYSLEVCREAGEDLILVWKSGEVKTRSSINIAYAGEALLPKTRYRVHLTVRITSGETAEKETFFETGLLNPDLSAWQGAEWIGSPREILTSSRRGVFAIESSFRIQGGVGRGGIVFGAGDRRLLDPAKNEYGISGENYISYELVFPEENENGERARLEIFRVGYAPGDSKDQPFAVTDLPALDRNAFHTLRVEVYGDNAKAFLDGELIDAALEKNLMGQLEEAGRTLNPRGFNDVVTYPRLNQIGFSAGKGSRLEIRKLEVRNLRAPGRAFIREVPGSDLEGRESLFDSCLRREGECFVLEGEALVTREPRSASIPMLRRGFDLKEKKIAEARIYATARGIYSLYVNGEELPGSILSPGLTQYDKRINYQTYDVTKLLTGGKNAIGAVLSSGWWSDASTFTVRNFNYFGDRESLLLLLCVRYADGEMDEIVSRPGEWKVFTDGPYRYSGFFLGEILDGRKVSILEDFSLPDFDDASWEAAEEIQPVRIPAFYAMPKGFGRPWPEVNAEKPLLIGGYDAPVSVVDRRSAISREEEFPGVYVYDLGQEMAGVPRIRLRETAGTEIIIRYAEIKYPDLPEYSGRAGTLMMENYRDATSTDLYICHGGENEVYQPRFTFHGFRYIEISGAKNPPEPFEVEGLQYSSIEAFDGAFVSDHALLNRFAENVRWSQLCNFINIPTDCPQRNERMGWAGDSHVFCHTALLGSNLEPFYVRNIQAACDLQTPEGQFPEIMPIGGGFGGITYEIAPLVLAEEIYRASGNARVIERFWPNFVRYMDYMKDKGLPGDGDFAAVGPLGDWLAPEETDLPLLWNAFYYREARQMSRFAEILGKEEERQAYEALGARIKAYWQERFIDPETGKTRNGDGSLCDSESSYAIGICYGLAKDPQAFGEHLSRKAKSLHHTVGTGFFGTGLLNFALTETGHLQDAYKNMLKTDCPSWLYPVTQGATTIWERWNSFTREKGFGGNNAMNSFNHYSLGSVLSWLYEMVLGIQRDPGFPGEGRFIFHPHIQEGFLHTASGSIASPYGKIQAAWHLEGKEVSYFVSLPANTTGSLILPAGKKQEFGSGEHLFCFSI